ncbi:hypothetical protein [Lederbergia citrea]|nr:hypothetical protein [Lederbergia citrea]
MEVELHLPDLDFVRQTKEKFSVNRGVYNTIDSWFYENGLVNIVDRRHHITAFLEYSHKTAQDKLFPNGLTKKLEEYLGIRQTNKIGLLDN